MRLTPRDAGFYDLFSAAAVFLTDAADALVAMLGAQDPEERRSIAERMSDLETGADQATHTIIKRANTAFITPFDREDIHRLAIALDDCVDHMDAAADLIDLYEIDGLPKRVTKQVEVLARMADLTAAAMSRLRAMRDLSDYWIEINRLENTADKAYRRMVAKLYNTPGADPITVMKNKEVIDELEKAADAFERVATLVEGLAVKES